MRILISSLTTLVLLSFSVAQAGGGGGGGGNRPDPEAMITLNQPNNLSQLVIEAAANNGFATNPATLGQNVNKQPQFKGIKFDYLKTNRVTPRGEVEFQYLPSDEKQVQTHVEFAKNVDPVYLRAMKQSLANKKWVGVPVGK